MIIVQAQCPGGVGFKSRLLTVFSHCRVAKNYLHAVLKATYQFKLAKLSEVSKDEFQGAEWADRTTLKT